MLFIFCLSPIPTVQHPVQPQPSTGEHWELPSTTTVYYCWDYGSCLVQPHSSTGGHSELPSKTSLLMADTGSFPVQPCSSIGGLLELPSTTPYF